MTEYLTLREVMELLRYDSKTSASNFIKRKGIPFIRRRQAMLIDATALRKHLDSVTTWKI